MDQGLPEIAKIVKISYMFSVNTDLILIDEITTFNLKTDRFVCGVYRSPLPEIVKTESRQYLGDMTNDVLVWPVKCYTDDATILRGCGDEEYQYGRKEQRTEIFV